MVAGATPKNARPGGAEWMSKCDRTAIDVKLLVWNAKTVTAVNDLYRESLIQLNDVHLRDFEPGERQHLLRRRRRPSIIG